MRRRVVSVLSPNTSFYLRFVLEGVTFVWVIRRNTFGIGLSVLLLISFLADVVDLDDLDDVDGVVAFVLIKALNVCFASVGTSGNANLRVCNDTTDVPFCVARN